MFSMAGESSGRYGGKLLNSASNIHRMLTMMGTFLYLLLPAIIGSSVFRDTKNNMHTILYSLPFTKKSYLFAKFLSALSIVLSILILLNVGLLLGTILPGVNPDLLLSFKASNFIQPFILFHLPNIIILSTVVFCAVVMSRNIYVGFMAYFY